MALEYSMILNNELLNKDTYVVPEQALLIIWDSRSDIYMDKYGKNTKHTRKFSRIMHLVKNGKRC